MRVQAKRVQRNDALRIKYKVASSRSQQRDLLITGALADGLKPFYCIYCTERQRLIWKQNKPPRGFANCETGCLLANAHHVPLATTRLRDIEDKCPNDLLMSG